MTEKYVIKVIDMSSKENEYQPVVHAIEVLCNKFGAKLRSRETDDPAVHNAAIRVYTENRGYLAITRPEEPLSQVYSALSFAVFPLKVETLSDSLKCFTCLVSICIGTGDLGEDEELASLPYLRRSYTKLLPKSKMKQGFIKTSFTDTITDSVALFDVLKAGEESQGWTVSKILRYKKLLPAAVILTFTENDILSVENNLDKEGLVSDINDFTILAAWLAQYAKIRGWNYNNKNNNRLNLQDNAIRAITRKSQSSDTEIQDDIKQLVDADSYIVLQGAPGTGKTRAAVKFAEDNHMKVFFTQFHAETTYADFVGGIRPVLNKNKGGNNAPGESLGYKYCEGIFTQAIRYAIDNNDESVVLIIDEINRANLQNVVGPMFYLLERGSNGFPVDRSVAPITLLVEDGEDIKLSSMPANLKIIATMNTSDRSLAVVDFALRRRFVWYTMPVLDLGPQIFGGEYQERLFQRITDLFDKYATDEELSLQPGHSYFIAQSISSMNHRLKYELMPLMKEYFANGLLLGAQNEFADLYFQEVGEFMYR